MINRIQRLTDGHIRYVNVNNKTQRDKQRMYTVKRKIRYNNDIARDSKNSIIRVNNGIVED